MGELCASLEKYKVESERAVAQKEREMVELREQLLEKDRCKVQEANQSTASGCVCASSAVNREGILRVCCFFCCSPSVFCHLYLQEEGEVALSQLREQLAQREAELRERETEAKVRGMEMEELLKAVDLMHKASHNHLLVRPLMYTHA